MADSSAPLMLSISGMRGLVGRSITPDVAARYTAAFGSWLKTARDTARPTVVLGRDSRPSGEMFENAAAAGLVSVGRKVVSVGVLSKPVEAIKGQHVEADGGIVITASHNPAPWNGIKPLRHDGVAPPPEAVENIIARFKADEADHVEVEQLQPIETDTTGVEVHRDLVAELVDVELLRDAKLKAVVDSVHGAGGAEAAALLDLLGVDTVQLYKEPTGRFPHVPEPTKENLTELCEVVAREQAHVGFAQGINSAGVTWRWRPSRPVGGWTTSPRQRAPVWCGPPSAKPTSRPACGLMTPSSAVKATAGSSGGPSARSAIA